MRHDYSLPPDWAAMTSEEKNIWFHREREYRRAKKQDTAFARHLKKGEKRHDRRVSARNETQQLEP